VANHGIDHLVARGAGLQHRAGHVAKRAQQTVAVLEVRDESLTRERAADQLRSSFEHQVRRWCAPHRREPVAAEHDQVAVGLLCIAERVGRDRVKLGVCRHSA